MGQDNIFSFDYVFGSSSNQAQIFDESVAPLVEGECTCCGARELVGVVCDRPYAHVTCSLAYAYGQQTHLCGHSREPYSNCIISACSAAFEGFNATILAYGQTGSGKTYTMGSSSNFRLTDEEQGIIPRVIQSMFEMIEQKARDDPTIMYGMCALA
jgi:hypothetical protein